MRLFERLSINSSKNYEVKFIPLKYNKEHSLIKFLEKLPYNKIKNILTKYNLDSQSLNKKAKINLLLNKLMDNITSFKTYMNNYQLKFVEKLIKNDGIIKYSPQYNGFLKLFYQYGLCIPIICENEKSIIMPKEICKYFKDINDNIINLNTKITDYTRGMVNLYGIVENDYLVNEINKYIEIPLQNSYILKAIKFDIISNDYITSENELISNIFIIDYIDNYQNTRKTVPNYYPYTSEEIISSANPEYIRNDLTTKQHIINIADIFNLSIEEAKDLMINLQFILKEDINFHLLVSTFKDINIDKIDQKLEYILNINNNIPKWSLKGHKYHHLNLISPLTIKKIVELLLLN